LAENRSLLKRMEAKDGGAEDPIEGRETGQVDAACPSA
jgi:hypothetical protein